MHRYFAVILFAAEAGLRAGEIRGLQFSDVKAGQITVRRALDKLTNDAVAPKHNKARTIPLSPRLLKVLADLPRYGLWVILARILIQPLDLQQQSADPSRNHRHIPRRLDRFAD